MTYDINHKLNFKSSNDGLTIVTDWNTRRLYLDEDYHVDRSRTVLALCRYNLYAKTTGLREAHERAGYGLQAACYNLSPATNWERLRGFLYAKTAGLRHMRDVHRMRRFCL
jgi:hypothetical protein